MRPLLRPLITVILALMLAGPALADDLGRVSVPLADASQSDEARQAALKQGLEQVIARLTGKPVDQVDSLPGVGQALQQPDRWLLRYGYESGDPPRLRAAFDTDSLAGYLAGQGAPVWSGPRPTVLVWLVDEGNGRGHMVGADDDFAATVSDDAAGQGLKVALPHWDDQDRKVLSVADIRGRFDDALEKASQRYQTDWIATGVIYGGNRPTINWRLLNGGDTVADKRQTVASRAAAVQAMMSGIGETLADRFRTRGGGGAARPGQVAVRGVNTLRAWRDLSKNIVGLGAVSAVHLRRADGGTLDLAVDFAGGRDELERALASLPMLRECAAGAGDAGQDGGAGADDGNAGQNAGGQGQDATPDAAAARPPLTFCER